MAEKQFRPMLAATSTGKDIKYPVYASPKLDGIRACIINGVVLSRSLKPIPNRHIQEHFGKIQYSGLDMELVADDFNTATRLFMSRDGDVFSTDCGAAIFDDFLNPNRFFAERYGNLSSTKLNRFMRILPQTIIDNEQELEIYEAARLAEGYEGVILRDPCGLYKYGRSTLSEQGMLKLKRFEDSEAVITGVLPLYTNANPAYLDKLGLTKRSTAQAGRVIMAKLGKITVCDLKTGVEFEIGTGFDDASRVSMWTERDKLIGQVVKYKHLPYGVKDKPRHPVFLGIRDRRDMS